MKYVSGLILALALFIVPAAQAQHSHGSGHNSGHSAGRSSGHSAGRGHFDVNHGRLRDDHERERFGREHLYRGGVFRWYGPEYVIGSRFFIGGFWFEIGEPWFGVYEPGTYDYYVEWDETEAAYFVYAPSIPGRRIVVSVVF